MATTTTARRRRTHGTVLYDISYKTYVRLRSVDANRHLPMIYNDGTMEIISPKDMRHERPTVKIGLVVRAVTSELGIAWSSTLGMTFRRAGSGPLKGKGKEPDESYYIARARWLGSRESVDLDAGEPPPDLGIEVDHRSSSQGRLPVYAGLGIPEVWQYRARKQVLRFLRLVDGAYQSVARSEALPMLTTTLVLEAMRLGEGISDLTDMDSDRLIRAWVREKFLPAAPET